MRAYKKFRDMNYSSTSESSPTMPIRNLNFDDTLEVTEDFDYREDTVSTTNCNLEKITVRTAVVIQ